MTETNLFIKALTEWSELLMRRTMRDFLEFARSSGLTMPQISTLYALRYNACFPVSDIASRLDVSNAAASQMVDRLEQQGLVERTFHPGDRRVRLVQLTDQGRTLVQQGIEVRLHWIADLARMVAPDRQEAIVAALATLTEAARQLDPSLIAREEV